MRGGDDELLEREFALEALVEAFKKAERGAAAAVVVEGAAGLGKSALLDLAAADAAQRGFTVLRARGGALEQTLSWGVARQLFEDVVARSAQERRARLLSGSAGLVTGLFGLAQQPAPTQLVTNDGHREHGLYWLACNLAEEQGLVLVIDDAHWCDTATAQWLVYLLRRADQLPLTLVMAVRPREPNAPEQSLGMIATMPLAQTLTLRPLSVEATATLLEREYTERIDLDFVRACHRWTGGNPLFARSLARELAQERVSPVATSVQRIRQINPESAARVILLRIARLSAPAHEAARAVAVLESAPDASIVFDLAGLAADDGAAALDELIAAGVLADEPPIAFAHPLAGAVVYGDIGPNRRALLHKQAAALLLTAGAEPGRIGAHLLRSSPQGEQWVVSELRRAARSELSTGSPSSAVALLRRAIAEPPTDDELAGVLFELGASEAMDGAPEATATLRDALARTADPIASADVSLILGRMLLIGGETRAALDAARAGADRVDWIDPDRRLQLEALLINAARLDADLVSLIPGRMELIRDHARDESHGGRLIAAQLSWGLTAICAPAERALKWARRGLADGLTITTDPSAGDAYLGAVHMLAFNDALEEADAHLVQAIDLAQRAGSLPAFAAASCMRAHSSLLAGRLDEAELLARDALRATDEVAGTELLRGWAQSFLTAALTFRGELQDAYSVIDEDVEALERSTLSVACDMLFARGITERAAGRYEHAAAALLACGRRTIRWGSPTPAWLPWRSEAALVLRALGDTDEAVRLCDEELALARAIGAGRTLGIALRACGLVHGDVGLLEESVEALSSSPAHLERARSLIELGRARRIARGRAEARQPLTDGLMLAERCGAVPLARDARTELAAAGARPRLVIRTGADALTASERRVCELAASGKSNPEIAQLLFVTRATVESHLHSAYRRLDISSRSELAGALASGDQ